MDLIRMQGTQFLSALQTLIYPETLANEITMASANSHSDSIIDVVVDSTARQLLGRALNSEETEALRRDIHRHIGSRVLAHRNGDKTKLTPPELARLWGISPDKVLTWIRRGELRAINVATTRNGRPRYLIDIDDIRSFEARRSVVTRTTVRRGTKHKNSEVIEFF